MTKVPEQLDIMVNTECNAKCAFCVQEVTHKPESGKEAAFLEAVRASMDYFYGNGGRKVIITGGEPTLKPARVEKILEILTEFPSLELITMYTNGTQLLKEIEGKTIAQRLLRTGLQCVNLSIHHYDNGKNNAIFGVKTNPEAVSAHLKEIGLPFRYCATLQKGGLEMLEDVLKYVDFAKANGAKDVYFRELFQFKGLELKPGIEVSRSKYVPIKPIIEELIQKGYTPIGTREKFQGRNKNEIRFEIDGMPVYFSALEIGNEKSEKLPYLVVMPDGKLRSTWHETDVVPTKSPYLQQKPEKMECPMARVYNNLAEFLSANKTKRGKQK